MTCFVIFPTILSLPAPFRNHFGDPQISSYVSCLFLFKDNMMVFLKGNDGSDGQNGTQVCHLDPKFKRQQ